MTLQALIANQRRREAHRRRGGSGLMAIIERHGFERL
jgi:hypothetical protein